MKSSCIIIPDSVIQTIFQEEKEKTNRDLICVWPQGSELGIYLMDISSGQKYDYQQSYLFLKNHLFDFGYNINDCDAIYYTTSKFYIAVWNEVE